MIALLDKQVHAARADNSTGPFALHLVDTRMNVSVARYPAAVPAPRCSTSLRRHDAEWDRFVRTRREASGYHMSGWRGVFEGAFGHDTAYLAAREEGAIVGVLPLVVFRSRVFGTFAVSLPFVNYGGVLAEDDDVAQALVARAAALAEAGKLSHVELRHTVRQMPQLPARTHKVTMRLALGNDAVKAWDGLDRKVRNQVRKAEKSGLTWRRGGVEMLDSLLLSVRAENARSRHTVYSRGFFEHILWAFPATATV